MPSYTNIAAPISFLLSQVRDDVAALAGGKVYFYEAGTTTPMDVWLDNAKESLAANPYTLDVYGTAQVYGDGDYRIVIKDAEFRTIFDRDGLHFAPASANGTTPLAIGTVDAIVCSYVPAVLTLPDQLTLSFSASGANTSTTPTFTPNAGLIAPSVIVKGAGAVLAAGDLAGLGYLSFVRWDEANTRWVLVNPATSSAAIVASSCTGNSATATTAAACTGNAATATRVLGGLKTINGASLIGSTNIVLPTSTGVSLDCGASGVNTLGCLCFCYLNGTLSPGGTVAGSSLKPAGAASADPGTSTSLTGTWRCLGRVGTSSPYIALATLFQKISVS